MPSQPVTNFADQLLSSLRKELERPAAVQTRSREVLAAILLSDHNGHAQVPLEQLRTLPAGLRFNLTVTDDAAYRIEVTEEDGTPYRLPEDPADFRGRTADGLDAWSDLASVPERS
jgi:hypothetical protein